MFSCSSLSSNASRPYPSPFKLLIVRCAHALHLRKNLLRKNDNDNRARIVRGTIKGARNILHDTPDFKTRRTIRDIMKISERYFSRHSRILRSQNDIRYSRKKRKKISMKPCPRCTLSCYNRNKLCFHVLRKLVLHIIRQILV